MFLTNLFESIEEVGMQEFIIWKNAKDTEPEVDEALLRTVGNEVAQ